MHVFRQLSAPGQLGLELRTIRYMRRLESNALSSELCSSFGNQPGAVSCPVIVHCYASGVVGPDGANGDHPRCSEDTVSEWLRRWTRNPLGSARRGSNPLGVAFWFRPTNMICAAIIIFAQRGSLAERSKALASGASPKGREFESHSCHFFQN